MYSLPQKNSLDSATFTEIIDRLLVIVTQIVAFSTGKQICRALFGAETRQLNYITFWEVSVKKFRQLSYIFYKKAHSTEGWGFSDTQPSC